MKFGFVESELVKFGLDTFCLFWETSLEGERGLDNKDLTQTIVFLVPKRLEIRAMETLGL